MNSRYRCRGCREYKPAPPWRLTGLGGVCSQPCFETAVRKPSGSKPGVKKTRSRAETLGRERALFRDRGRCRFCGGSSEHVHHIFYRSQGVDHQPHNMISLCREHHDLMHSDKKRWQPVLLATIWLTEVEGKRFTVPQVERLLSK